MHGKYRELHRLLLWRNLGVGWQPSTAFPRQDRPVFLEVGFGNGEYLVRQALNRPEHNFLGIELHWGSVRRTLRRLAQAGLDNVRVLQMDAHVALRYTLADACFAGFVALFPCPWPKRSHEKFRLFSQGFMAHVNRVLTENAPGLVVTDDRALMEFASRQVQGTGLELRVETVPATYNTKYERRWSGQGQEVFYELHYRRLHAPTVQRAREVDVQTLTVPHLNPKTLRLEGQSGEPTIEFRQQVFDPERGVWMVLVVIVEDHLNQTFWIEAVRKDDGLWYIRPAPGGGFLPTIGVQQALALVQRAAQ